MQLRTIRQYDHLINIWVWKNTAKLLSHSLNASWFFTFRHLRQLLFSILRFSNLLSPSKLKSRLQKVWVIADALRRLIQQLFWYVSATVKWLINSFKDRRCVREHCLSPCVLWHGSTWYAYRAASSLHAPSQSHHNTSDLLLNADQTHLPTDEQDRIWCRHHPGETFRGTIIKHFFTKNGFQRVWLENMLLIGDN